MADTHTLDAQVDDVVDAVIRLTQAPTPAARATVAADLRRALRDALSGGVTANDYLALGPPR